MNHKSIILIVDDEPGARRTLEGLLRPFDYDLVFATNGFEALALAEERKPDLILLDVMMPGMDGFTVCQKLRATPSVSQVPVIFLTALDDRDARLQGIQSGADDFISKPFDRMELRTRVQTITRLNRYRRLLEEQTKFAWVAEQASDGYLLLDDHDTILYANAQACTYLGLPHEPVIRLREPFRLVAQKQYHAVPAEHWAGWPSQPSEPSARYLVRPETESTGELWLRVQALALPEGSGGSVLIQLRDVTSQMVMQRDTWKFHSLIHHKLRTPLISLYSLDMLANHVESLSCQQIAEIARLAVLGAKRLRSQIDEVLTYTAQSHIPNGAGVLLAEIEEMANTIASMLELEPVHVALQARLNDTRLGISRHGMELVLAELIGNAKKFHPEQRPNIELLVFEASLGSVCMQIRDDGITIPAERMAQVWVPYYQGEKYFTGEVSGMGLGLSMVASMVWSVGGTCRMLNRDDVRGVVVELVIPVVAPDRLV